ncbi:PREDICTED: protein boule-like isoform X2 [Priapulus caudatus]|uniref:Protein boule-like isoform X2 n=1 Tax=Priapulus caudatus TaxID=37621 RepID=A0ABM1E3H1_PRICU|nr:PREDICTED: protein boule-like isoform X2 [Priapulus caudatus]
MSTTSSHEGMSPVPSPTDSLPNATHPPKYGTLIPNRIFVGGIPANTNDIELKAFFSVHGAVREAKIIADRAGVSKGYGFVTFEREDEVKKILEETEGMVFKERKLNIGPAIRKQPFCSKVYYSPQPMGNGAIMYDPAVPSYSTGLTIYSPDAGTGYSGLPQPQAATYPITQPSIYSLPQSAYAQYQTPVSPPQASWSQWRWATPQGGSYVAFPNYMPPEAAMMYVNSAAQHQQQQQQLYAMEASAEQASVMEPGPPEGSMAPSSISPKFEMAGLQPGNGQGSLLRKPMPPSLMGPAQHQHRLSQSLQSHVHRPMPYSPTAPPPTVYAYSADPQTFAWIPVSERTGKPRLVAKTVNGVKVLVEELNTSGQHSSPPPTHAGNGMA